MDKLKERAQQYHDGMITAREFLGFIVDIAGDLWGSCTEDTASETVSELASGLADLLRKS